MVKEGEPNIIDIESTGIECESDPRNEPLTGGKRAKSPLKSVVGTLSFEGSDDGEDSSNSTRNSLKTSDEDDEYDDIESLVNSKFEGDKDHMPLLGKTRMKEKHKTRNTKKPPRPRKGPSLNTSDLQLVREISELVMKKRARVERLKAMKKMRTVRSSSSSSLSLSSSSPSSSSLSKSSIFAMMVTILFFIIILFQGFGSSHQQLEPVV